MCSRISVRGGSGAALAMTARPARPQRGLLNATLREPSCAKHAPGEAWRTRRAPRAATHRWLTEGCRMTRVMRGRFGVSTGGSALCEKASCPTLDNLVPGRSLLSVAETIQQNQAAKQKCMGGGAGSKRDAERMPSLATKGSACGLVLLLVLSLATAATTAIQPSWYTPPKDWEPDATFSSTLPLRESDDPEHGEVRKPALRSHCAWSRARRDFLIYPEICTYLRRTTTSQCSRLTGRTTPGSSAAPSA